MPVEKVISEWKNKIYKPVYWLEGEEPYFIDSLVHYAEHNILQPEEASFNLTIFYGRDTDRGAVVNACMRYPMFAERQVVIIKEAQHMKDIDKLETYIEKPLVSTILIISYKDKKLDARTRLAKTVKQKGELITAKKLYDNQLPDWIQNLVHEQGRTIDNKALRLLVDHVGNDLSRLQNEIEKLTVNLAGQTTITEEHIEKYIGISKEFNVFELQDAIAGKNVAKALQIIQYFKSNPKAAPIQLVLPTLYSYFSRIWSAAHMRNPDEASLKPLFYNNSFAAKQAVRAIQMYNAEGLEKILLLLYEYNLRSVGINSAETNDAELMKEMIIKMIF